MLFAIIFLCLYVMGCYGIKSPRCQPVGWGDSAVWLVNRFRVAHVSRPERGHQVSALSVNSTERMKLTLPVIKLRDSTSRGLIHNIWVLTATKICLHAEDVEHSSELLKLLEQFTGETCKNTALHSLGNLSHKPVWENENSIIPALL